jgi:hypothetical protein
VTAAGGELAKQPHMGDNKSPLSLSPMGGRDRDRELLIPVSGGGSAPGDGAENGDRASSSASAALSSSGREVRPRPRPRPPASLPSRFRSFFFWPFLFNCCSANLI